MNFVWYVCDGKVEEYDGQEADWVNSVGAFARSYGVRRFDGPEGEKREAKDKPRHPVSR